MQALLNSALDPVLDRVESEAQDAPAELLGVSVIDPACGSGHFLLAAARRIATRVARLRTGGVASAADYRHALRDAVRCCIHGVDRNPMAIELARVALWIETVEPGKPLGFLDANLRIGDSLLGIFDLKALEKGIPDAAYKPLTGDHKPTANDFKERNKRDKGEAAGFLDFSGSRRGQTVELPRLAASMRAVRQLPEDTVQQVHDKRQRYQIAHADPHLTNLEQAADLYIAAFLTPKTEAQSLDLHTALVPTTGDVWTATRSGTIYGPRLGAARKLASNARAFHWPIEFPDVMNAGGFNVVLGNPPWERIKLSEQEFFASREPAIAEASNAATRRSMIEQLRQAETGTRNRSLYEELELTKRIAEASSEFVRVGAEDCGRFLLTGRGDVNTYALFAELFTTLARRDGRTGIIVPTGLITDFSTSAFFGSLVSSARLIESLAFDNQKRIFPTIHPDTPFTLLTTGECATRAAFAAYLLLEPDLADARRRYTLSPAEIAAINPNTKTAPVFRSRHDAELTAQIYSRIPALIDHSKPEDGNPWGMDYASKLFDMTYDAGVFVTETDIDKSALALLGANWIDRKSHAIRLAPLWEAKYINLYDHRWDDTALSVESQEDRKQDQSAEICPRYWVESAEVDRRLAKQGWHHNWLLGCRKITNATNERTFISAIWPRGGVGNSLHVWLPDSAIETTRIAALLANTSSLVFDYVVRQKLGGTNLNFFYIAQCPVLPPGAYRATSIAFIVPRVLELTYTSHAIAPFAHDLNYKGPPFTWLEDRRALLRAELDAWYARAYGMTREELRYILDPADVMGPDYPSETFRVLKNNDTRKYGEYRTRRLVLDAWDRMEAGDLPAPQPYSAVQQVVDAGVNPLFSAGPLFDVPTAAPVRPPTRVPIDPYRLPAASWAADSSLPAYTVTQLAAIIHRLSGPAPITQVRLASLLALEPHLLTRNLQGRERQVWLRLVGNAAQPPSANNIVVFATKINAAWGRAVTQLRGMGEIHEDLNAGTWAEGSATSQYQIPAWADGRADFVLRAVSRISFDVLTADLSSEDRAWVNIANVA